MDFQSGNEVRFGLIIPSSNTTMEAEFWKVALGWAMMGKAGIKRKIEGYGRLLLK